MYRVGTLGITGAGETIVIVDSFGSPTIGPDLATFDQRFGYPAPPTFEIITPAGQVPAFDPNNANMVSWDSPPPDEPSGPLRPASRQPRSARADRIRSASPGG